MIRHVVQLDGEVVYREIVIDVQERWQQNLHSSAMGVYFCLPRQLEIQNV